MQLQKGASMKYCCKTCESRNYITVFGEICGKDENDYCEEWEEDDGCFPAKCCGTCYWCSQTQDLKNEHVCMVGGIS